MKAAPPGQAPGRTSQGPRTEMTIFPVREEAWTWDTLSSHRKETRTSGQLSQPERGGLDFPIREKARILGKDK